MGERQMQVTINYNGRAVAVEVTLEVYEFLDQADHKTENQLDCAYNMILSYNKFLKTIVVFYVYAILFFPTFLVYICLILLFLLKNNDVAYDILLTNQVLPYNYFLISPRFIPSGTFFC